MQSRSAGPIFSSCSLNTPITTRSPALEWGHLVRLNYPPAAFIFHPIFPGWDGFHLLAAMETRLRMPVAVESDANVAVLAEFAFGLGAQLGVKSLYAYSRHRGGEWDSFWTGSYGTAQLVWGGEAGHLTIFPDGPVCGCGNAGCLEVCASATAVVNGAERLISAGKAPGLARLKSIGSALTALDLAEAARGGDNDALAILSGLGGPFGIALAGLINILNLPLYVVGGGVAESWDLLAPSHHQNSSYVSLAARHT